MIQSALMKKVTLAVGAAILLSAGSLTTFANAANPPKTPSGKYVASLVQTYLTSYKTAGAHQHYPNGVKGPGFPIHVVSVKPSALYGQDGKVCMWPLFTKIHNSVGCQTLVTWQPTAADIKNVPYLKGQTTHSTFHDKIIWTLKRRDGKWRLYSDEWGYGQLRDLNQLEKASGAGAWKPASERY